MGFESHVDSDNKMVVATLSGTVDVEAAMQCTVDARRLADSHGYKRILFDIRNYKIRPTTVQIYDMAVSPEKRGLSREYKRATVISGEGQAEDLRFFENASVNRGYKVACFTDVEAAIAWLTTD